MNHMGMGMTKEEVLLKRRECGLLPSTSEHDPASMRLTLVLQLLCVWPTICYTVMQCQELIQAKAGSFRLFINKAL